MEAPFTEAACTTARAQWWVPSDSRQISTGIFGRDSAARSRQPDGSMSHQPAATRYDNPAFYRPCGRSGLKLPLLSLGLWHNFGADGCGSSPTRAPSPISGRPAFAPALQYTRHGHCTQPSMSRMSAKSVWPFMTKGSTSIVAGNSARAVCQLRPVT